MFFPYLGVNFAIKIKNGLNAVLRNDCYLQYAKFSTDTLRKPKKPTNIFIKFVIENRPKVRKEFPNISVKELYSRLSVMWLIQSSKERQKYIKQYEQEKNEYFKNIEKFMNNLSDEKKQELKEQLVKRKQQIQKNKRKLEIRRYNRPKRSPSSFGLFLKAKFKDKQKLNEEKTVQELFKMLLIDYNNLTEKERNEYREKSKIVNKEFHLNLRKWERKIIEAGKIHLLPKQKQLNSYKNIIKNNCSRNLSQKFRCCI